MSRTVVDTRVLDKIAGGMNANLSKIGRKIGFVIEGKAKVKAPVMTGALRNSIYTATQQEDNYALAAGAARQSNPGALTEPHPSPTGNIIAVVGPCVEYAEYQEFGTHKMAAHPYLIPAVEETLRMFDNPDMWEELFR